MTHVYFVRHAQPNYENHDDASRELTEKGLADRALVTRFLADREIGVVLSSPYKRAVDTVKEFADSRGYEIIRVDDFRERKIDSCWIEDFQSFSRHQWEDFDYKLSDGETLNEVQRRNVAALEQTVRQYEGQGIVIGSHGTALSTVINYYQPAFSFAEFEQIKPLMPWVVYFRFDGGDCVRIEGHDLFANTVTVLYER